jgi:RNA polymerase sigma-70 factor (ECF subfamily)
LTQTPASLLDCLREHPDDNEAWQRFDDIYRPLLRAWLGRYSLQPYDLEDIVQEVLTTVLSELRPAPGSRAVFRYDPARGRFRSWLRQILANRLREFWDARKRAPVFAEDVLNQLEDPNSELSRRWDREHDQHVIRRLLAQLEPDFRPATWQAAQRQFAGEDPKTVAAALGLSLDAVYLAKSHVLKRLRAAGRGLFD